MIVTELYNGQGLGNQLWNYFVTKIIATKKGYKHGVISTEKFKGKEFLDIDFGQEVEGGSGPEGGPPNSLPKGVIYYYKEKITRHPSGLDISKYDEKLFEISDNTKIDGNLQSFEYIKNHKELIRSFFKIKEGFLIEDYNHKDICVIHIRGGDFSGSSALLGFDYYQNGINKMLEVNKNMKFYIITDDIGYSKSLFPNIEIIGSATSGMVDLNKANHHMGGPIWMDWSILYNCKNAIISASSFSFWPLWLNKNGVNVIAPMYWADYKKSDGYWSCGDSLIEDWHYLDRFGNYYDYNHCLKLKLIYEEKNKHLWN
jgi:hypothetical protein